MLIVEPVRKRVVVAAAVGRAFRAFTAEIGSWWRGHPESPPLGGAVLEAWPGGRWLTIASNGVEQALGRVLACEAPSRLVLVMFQLTPCVTPDPAFETEVELGFREVGPERTLVELEHRQLERYGADVPAVRGHLNAVIGWQATLHDFAAALQGSPTQPAAAAQK